MNKQTWHQYLFDKSVLSPRELQECEIINKKLRLNNLKQ